MKKLAALLMSLLIVTGLAGTASASSGWSVAKSKAKVKVVRIYHPCDWNKNTVFSGSLERLCMKVWKQDAYTLSDKKGRVHSESPSGPAIVTDLAEQARAEGKKYATAYFRDGLNWEAKAYKKRDK